MTRRKILLVDDSKTALMATKLLLRSDEFDVITADDGFAALERARCDKPDLILLDMIMPRMNGLDACKALRAHPDTSTIPVIMVTTRAEADYVEQAFVNGCTDYVTKPVNRHELLAKVRSCLPQGEH